jgi:hypothetical protein
MTHTNPSIPRFRAGSILTALVPMAAILLCGARAKQITLPVETVFLTPSALPGYVYASGFCAPCHSADYMRYQPQTLSLAAWKAEVIKMRDKFGAPIPPEAVDPIADYLVKTYGAERNAPPPAKDAP